METWNNRNLKNGNLEKWTFGKMEIWKNVNLEIWKFGKM